MPGCWDQLKHFMSRGKGVSPSCGHPMLALLLGTAGEYCLGANLIVIKAFVDKIPDKHHHISALSELTSAL